MLTLTESANQVVRTIVDRDPNVTDGGLRLAQMPGNDRQFQVAVVAEPHPGDSLVEDSGARVFLEPATTVLLDDKTLDAQIAEDGAVTFALIPQ